MNTSSRKGILPVRLGIQPDTQTALSELNMDPNLTNSMTDKELDLLIIDNEYQRILKFYEGKDEDGKGPANTWKAYAMQQIISN